MSTARRSASVSGTVVALLAVLTLPIHAAEPWEFEGDRDWQTIVRTIDATKERQQKLGVPLSDKDYEDLKESYKPGFREYKNQLRNLQEDQQRARTTQPSAK